MLLCASRVEAERRLHFLLYAKPAVESECSLEIWLMASCQRCASSSVVKLRGCGLSARNDDQFCATRNMQSSPTRSAAKGGLCAAVSFFLFVTISVRPVIQGCSPKKEVGDA